VKRTLVVNADDLGLTAGVNTGIIEAHEDGILTSASLMANAPATADAIRRLRTRPALGIGVHLLLVDGAPILAPGRVPTLVDRDGRFRPSWRPFIVDCLTGRIALDEIERELTAQIDRLRSERIRLTHLDAHKHVHAYPPVFEVVARLARRFEIPVVRVPYEQGAAVPPAGWQRPIVRRQSLANAAMWWWARRDLRIAAAHRLTVPRFTGRRYTGVLDLRALALSIRGLGPGTTELMVHPGYVDDRLRQMPTRLQSSRRQELELLKSPTTALVLTLQEIRLARHDRVPVDRPERRSLRDAS
jgi:predicted glycoside hydrolase/deacetylase ChbG (UPF0249 family)